LDAIIAIAEINRYVLWGCRFLGHALSIRSTGAAERVFTRDDLLRCAIVPSRGLVVRYGNKGLELGQDGSWGVAIVH
jgi:hypothetical protein